MKTTDEVQMQTNLCDRAFMVLIVCGVGSEAHYEVKLWNKWYAWVRVYQTNYLKETWTWDSVRRTTVIRRLKEANGPVVKSKTQGLHSGSPLSYVTKQDSVASDLTKYWTKWLRGGNHEFNYGLDYLNDCVLYHPILCSNIFN